MDYDAIRHRLKEAIAHREDATPRNVSLKAGLSDSALHKFLTGSSRTMTIEKLQAVARAIDIPLRYLTHGDVGFDVVSDVWDAIPEEKRGQALDILKTFLPADSPLNDMDYAALSAFATSKRMPRNRLNENKDQPKPPSGV